MGIASMLAAFSFCKQSELNYSDLDFSTLYARIDMVVELS